MQQASLGVGLNSPRAGLNGAGKQSENGNEYLETKNPAPKIYEKDLHQFQKQSSKQQEQQQKYFSSGSLNDQRFPAIKINGQNVGMVAKVPSKDNINAYEYDYSKNVSLHKEETQVQNAFMKEVENEKENLNFLKEKTPIKIIDHKKNGNGYENDDDKWKDNDVPEDPQPSIVKNGLEFNKTKTLTSKNSRIKKSQNNQNQNIGISESEEDGRENVSSYNNEYMQFVQKKSEKIKKLDSSKNQNKSFNSPFPISQDPDDSYDIQSQPKDQIGDRKLPTKEELGTVSKQIDYCLPSNKNPSSLQDLHHFTASRYIKMNTYSEKAKNAIEKYTKEIEDLFSKNKVIPQGPFLCSDGSTYIGEIDSEGFKDGLGEEIDPDGSGYKGEFKKNVRYGKGRFVSANGLHYYGNYINGIATGKGVLSCEHFVYTGEFDDSLMHGQGELVYTDGTKFVGFMVKNVKNGPGSFTFYNGTTYVGDFEDDMMQGYGKNFIFF